MTHAEAPLDLFRCDREPIHQLGMIQSFGFLLAVSSAWEITGASQNSTVFLGRDATTLLGHPLTELFTREAIHELKNRLSQLAHSDLSERIFGVGLLVADPGRLFDCAIHYSRKTIVIEAEPSSPATTSEVAGLLRAMTARLDATDSLTDFLRQGARQVHLLTGFDRVMVYRFDPAGSGEVVAETRRSSVGSFLGLHFPASDIPQQARDLYLRNPFRIICDVDAPNAPIVTGQDDDIPLDLSLSVLRAVSPIHLQYLRNMGVKASLSISIIVDGRLWGLFACHNAHPKCLPFDIRTIAELLAQLFSLRLEGRLRHAAMVEHDRARTACDRMLAAVSADIGLLQDPDWLMTIIGDICACDGMAVALEGRSVCTGATPDPSDLPAIAALLRSTMPDRIFASDHLAAHLPQACAAPHSPAGMLAIPISTRSADYLMLFRREQLRSVAWAGDPNKPVALDGQMPTEYALAQHRPTLSPRISFDVWREEVSERSEPFSDREMASAEALRTSIVEVALRLAGAAAEERIQAMQRQEVLIAELNHRVRNVLAVVGSLIGQSPMPSDGQEMNRDDLQGRITALAQAHSHITRRNWGPAELSDLFDGIATQFAKSGQMTVDGAPIMLIPEAFSTLSLVMHELMTNSVKHGALSTEGYVRVSWTPDHNGDLDLAWIETGGPSPDADRRPGFGTNIIERSVPHDLGGQATIDYVSTGVRACFKVPARYIRQSDTAVPAPVPIETNSVAVLRKANFGSLGRVLVVEDSLLIALHAQDLLLGLGVKTVVIAKSVAQAMREIDFAFPNLAILDFNLGEENSMAVADRLHDENVPYMFATGYGNQLRLDAPHDAVFIIQKPYNKLTFCDAFGVDNLIA